MLISVLQRKKNNITVHQRLPHLSQIRLQNDNSIESECVKKFQQQLMKKYWSFSDICGIENLQIILKCLMQSILFWIEYSGPKCSLLADFTIEIILLHCNWEEHKYLGEGWDPKIRPFKLQIVNGWLSGPVCGSADRHQVQYVNADGCVFDQSGLKTGLTENQLVKTHGQL